MIGSPSTGATRKRDATHPEQQERDRFEGVQRRQDPAYGALVEPRDHGGGDQRRDELRRQEVPHRTDRAPVRR